MRHRLVYLGLTALLVAVIALSFALYRNGVPTPLPAPLEAVTPHPNDAALRQAVIEVDLQNGYSAELWVDGVRVPDDEITVVEATGVYRWAPTVNGAYLTEWSPGVHTVKVVWNSQVGAADSGAFEWSFRIQ